MQLVQQPLFPTKQERQYSVPFPSTRYQGSKRKLLEWIWANVANLEFDSVLDLFGGSGTTLIAAEQLKRKCFMMELDPKYCDVILSRHAAVNPKMKLKKNGKAITWK